MQVLHKLLRCQNSFAFLSVLVEQVFPSCRAVYGVLGFLTGPRIDVLFGHFRYSPMWFFNTGYVLLDPDFRAIHWKRVYVQPKSGSWVHHKVYCFF